MQHALVTCSSVCAIIDADVKSIRLFSLQVEVVVQALLQLIKQVLQEVQEAVEEQDQKVVEREEDMEMRQIVFPHLMEGLGTSKVEQVTKEVNKQGLKVRGLKQVAVVGRVDMEGKVEMMSVGKVVVGVLVMGWEVKECFVGDVMTHQKIIVLIDLVDLLHSFIQIIHSYIHLSLNYCINLTSLSDKMYGWGGDDNIVYNTKKSVNITPMQ